MEFREYRFEGYQNYEDVQKDIGKVLEGCFGCVNPYYGLAMNEAVCNAAKYSLDGPAKAKIIIQLRTTPDDVALAVLARTRPFDATRYQRELRALLLRPEIRSLEWGDYTADTEKSRGFWYILMACDYMYMDAKGQSVTICRSRKFDPDEEVDTHIERLVPRFLVCKDGVIA